MTRVCTTCKVSQDEDQFGIDRTLKDGTRRQCKSCIKCYNKNISSEIVRARSLKSRYGLSLSDYKIMLANQNGRCAICGTDDNGYTTKYSMAVDHCHKTGKVRSLLCNRCNNGLGHFNDDRDLIIKALEYLECHREA